MFSFAQDAPKAQAYILYDYLSFGLNNNKDFKDFVKLLSAVYG